MNEKNPQQETDKETRERTKRGHRRGGMTRAQGQNTQDVVFRASSSPLVLPRKSLIPTLCWHSIAMPCLQSPLSLHLLTGVAFLKRECPCISLCPQDILAAQWLCYLNPLRFCFSPPTHCWFFCPEHTVTSRYRGVKRRTNNTAGCLTRWIKIKNELFFVWFFFFNIFKKKNYLDIREEGFQHVGAGVAGVEEH